MNPDQPRASGPPGADPALADLIGAAMARHRAGALGEAERQYRHILSLYPDHAETHGMLGATLLAQGKATEAIAHFERVVALRPGLLVAYDDLARSHMAAGRPELAIGPLSHALELEETAPRKMFFAHCVASVRFKEDDGRFGKLVLRALAEGWARPRELCGVASGLIKLGGAVNDAIARANAAWPARLSAVELFGAAGLSALAHDQLLLGLLACDPITDIGLERLLTNVRHAMLASATDSASDSTSDGTFDESLLDLYGTFDESLLDLYCAVARQCFINDYVFSQTDAETEAAQGLRNKLENTLAAGQPGSALSAIAVASYVPLRTLPSAGVLSERSWPRCVEALLVQQVKEPAEEHRIAATIPAITAIDGEVSGLVRRQYEESPYPRWIRLGEPQLPENAPQQGQTPEVLFAGCGTGLSTVEFALKSPGVRILAIDLSLASLSYAKRMAQKLHLANIEFAHADIMQSGTIGRQFDLIDSSGVLHHLADPWAGWHILLSLLRPGGTMQVGLYSEAARRNIVAARALIAARGYRPVPQDIRRCREDIIAAPDGSLLKSVTQWEDFFTISECRDLLFHVQEHRIDLREIKSFLAANGVEFAGFLLDGPTRQRFAARFPDPAAMTDLERWHEFETEAPHTFAAMYQFLVRKPAASAWAPTRSN